MGQLETSRSSMAVKPSMFSPAIRRAAANGCLPVVTYLLSIIGDESNECHLGMTGTARLATTVWLAVSNGHLSTAQYLIELNYWRDVREHLNPSPMGPYINMLTRALSAAKTKGYPTMIAYIRERMTSKD